jgi:hypothetical protein
MFLARPDPSALRVGGPYRPQQQRGAAPRLVARRLSAAGLPALGRVGSGEAARVRGPEVWPEVGAGASRALSAAQSLPDLKYMMYFHGKEMDGKGLVVLLLIISLGRDLVLQPLDLQRLLEHRRGQLTDLELKLAIDLQLLHELGLVVFGLLLQGVLRIVSLNPRC